MKWPTIVKTCPRCGPTVNLVVRVKRSTQEPFLGCPNWYTNGCPYTEEYPEALKLQALGAARLPGLDP